MFTEIAEGLNAISDNAGAWSADEIRQHAPALRVMLEKPVRLAVGCEGGLIQSVVTDCPVLVGLAVFVIDYDAEGADEESVSLVPQAAEFYSDGAVGKRSTDAAAVCHWETVDIATIKLADAIANYDAK